MRKFGLIGYPLGHSFSKDYFFDKFRKEGLECSYDNYQMTNINDLPDLINREPSLEGLNITIPHKVSVLSQLGKLDPPAMEVGAVNVIKIRRSESGTYLEGYNTDVYGFTESLLEIPGAKSSGSALVLGSGGSSLAVMAGLKLLGINYYIVSRSKERADITYNEISRPILNECRLIINTTPLGMHPDIDTCPDIPYKLLGSDHILFDLVYNPQRTEFLSRGEKQGCQVKNGLKMLHLQADKSWKIWNNK